MQSYSKHMQNLLTSFTRMMSTPPICSLGILTAQVLLNYSLFTYSSIFSNFCIADPMSSLFLNATCWFTSILETFDYNVKDRGKATIAQTKKIYCATKEPPLVINHEITTRRADSQRKQSRCSELKQSQSYLPRAFSSYSDECRESRIVLVLMLRNNTSKVSTRTGQGHHAQECQRRRRG